MKNAAKGLLVLAVTGAATGMIAAAPSAAANPLPKLCAPTGAGITCQAPDAGRIKGALHLTGYPPHGTVAWPIGGR